MPIPLGILAAAGFRPAAAGSFVLLESTVLTGSQASVEFTNLTSKYASTYQHLQIRVVYLSDIINNSLVARFNADGGSNYAYHRLNGNGSSVFSGAGTSKSNMTLHYGQDNNSATEPNVAVIDILDPFETTKNKTVRSLGGTSSGASKNQVDLWSSLWQSTTAVSSIGLSLASGYDGWQAGNFRQYSRFSLYGLKAA
jgi:hypothetical protein